MHAAMVLREMRQDTLWVGESAGSQWVRNRLWEVARTGLSVLILGEPGTGRRLSARLVHGVSRSPEAPFVRVDGGRLHAAQAEGVLFGDAEPGASAQAEGGTLFLEEIEVLPRVLQERMLQALTSGSSAGFDVPELVDVRVVAGTDRDLGKRARAGRFCPELFFRLALVPVRLSPLRKRRRDIPLLVDYFLEQIAARLGQRPPVMSREALVELLTYEWPGNVWELKRVLERVVVAVGEGEIEAKYVQRFLKGNAGEGDSARRCPPLTWN